MADVQQGGQEWVPPIGRLEVAPERAELIRGLYELAAWVADHPEVPLPKVRAWVSPSLAWRYDEDPTFEDKCGVVDRVAVALGVATTLNAAGTHYGAEAWFGPVEVASTAITAQRMAANTALFSYSDNVQGGDDQVAAGGAR